MVKWGTAEPEPPASRSAGPSGILSALHPDLQRPPTRPSPSFGGPGSAALLRSMSAEDGSDRWGGEEEWPGEARRVPPRSGSGLMRGFSGGGRRPLEWRKRRGNRGKTRTADSGASRIGLVWLAQRQRVPPLLSVLIGRPGKARFDWFRRQIGIRLRYWRNKYCFCRNCMWFSSILISIQKEQVLLF